MAESESSNSQESNALSSWSNFLSEALTIKAQGYLNEQREKAGVYQAVAETPQVPTRVENDGRNIATQSFTEQSKNWLVIGGGILIAIVVILLAIDLLGGSKGKGG